MEATFEVQGLNGRKALLEQTSGMIVTLDDEPTVIDDYPLADMAE